VHKARPNKNKTNMETIPAPKRIPANPARSARRRLIPALLACLAGGLCGCTVLTYTGTNGETFTRTSLGAQTSIASLAVEAGSNGVRRVELKGYQNETAQALGTVTEAAVRAALATGK